MNISEIMLERWDEISEIVEAAQQLPPEERASFVNQACKGDKELQAAVEWTLNNAEEVGGIGSFPQADGKTISDQLTPDSDSPSSHQRQFNNRRIGHRTGSRIGNYTIGTLLGAGGFGEVYRAERDYDGEKKQVAIKFIHTQSGMSRAEIVRRFRQERKILAKLGDHPNIARLIDGGQTEDEFPQPYLVMDYVDGVPIDEYCDEHKLPVAERLKLFRTVCAAVQFAHQKLIAHRDLKPSNILVSEDGMVKLLDFGIAKVLSSGAEGEAKELTEPGELLMTKEYASPEQVRGEAITVSTDVYSLGVVLYRLLTGHPPYLFKNRSISEAEKVICNQQPAKPSDVINQPAASGKIEPALESVSENRRMKPEKLRKQLQGSLANIVLMALRKEPKRRYGSAEQFSEDIRCYLEDLPKIARPDTRSERVIRFVRQNRAVVLATLLVILGLGGGLGTACAQWRKAVDAGLKLEEQVRIANEQSEVAKKEKKNAEEKTLIAKAAEGKAVEQAKIADEQKQVAQEREQEKDLLLKEKDLLLYAADLNLAATAFENGNPARINDLLGKYLPNPNGFSSNDFRDFAWYYLWRKNHDEKMTIKWQGRAPSVRSVSFVSDGKILALESWNGFYRIDARTGQSLAPLEMLPKYLGYRFALSPDGNTFAATHDNSLNFDLGKEANAIKLWDTRTGQHITTLNMQQNIALLAFAPDGKTLASANRDNTVKLWDARSGQLLATLKGHESSVNSLAFSSDGKTIASAAANNTVKLWDARTGQNFATLNGHGASSYYPISVAFTPDGKTLASAGYDQTIRLRDIRSGQLLATLKGHESTVNSIAFAPDGEILASASSDKTVKLWDVRTGQNLATLRGHERSVKSVAFAPNGKTLASASSDNMVKLWDTHTDLPPSELVAHPGGIESVAFAPDGKTFASASSDKTIKLWDARTGQNLATLGGHEDSVSSVAFAPDGKTLASASWDKTVKLWDVRTGQNLATLKGHERSVRSVAFAPDGKILASAGDDATIKLWDARTGQNLATLSVPNGKTFIKAHFPVESVAFAPDGKTLASAGSNGAVRFWDARSGQILATLKAHEDYVFSVAFSPNGKTLASAGRDGMVKLWDARSGQLLATLKAHDSDVNSVAFAPDGKTLASASSDKMVKLWDVRSRQNLATLRHFGRVNSVAFAPVGKALASADDLFSVRLWLGATDKQIEDQRNK